MKNAQEILAEVKDTLATKWQKREGTKVPEPEDVKLGNDAVMINGTVLYADIADSTVMVNKYRDTFAAEVYKSYLTAACHVIRNNNGVITAFDGDRVMAVYLGNLKNSSAATAALQLNWLLTEINVAIKREYASTAFVLRHSVGVDTSPLFVARIGIRKSNDLVWVGKAANYAAKLSNLSDPKYPLFITKDVFDQLTPQSKYGGNPSMCMWDEGYWVEANTIIYKSSWHWKFS